MDYPEAVIEKAKRHEKLLQRVADGESREQVCAELGIKVDQDRFAVLQAKYEAGGSTWQALLDGRHGHAQKMHSGIREWLHERKKQDEEVRAPTLVREIEEKFGVKVSDGHINYLLRKRGLTAPPGRPYKEPPAEDAPESSTESSESLDNAGIFFPGGREGRDGGDPGS
jgi:transposase